MTRVFDWIALLLVVVFLALLFVAIAEEIARIRHDAEEADRGS